MKRILVIAALTLLSSAGLVQAGAQSPAEAVCRPRRSL